MLGPRRVIDEPGRALVANGCVTLYEVQSIKRNVDTYVAVDGGMSDNLRPMLYGARYEAQIASRPGGGTRCHVVGKHCESGDILVRDAQLDDPRPGDIARHAGDRRLRSCDGQQLQRRAAAAGRLRRPAATRGSWSAATAEDLTSRDVLTKREHAPTPRVHANATRGGWHAGERRI